MWWTVASTAVQFNGFRTSSFVLANASSSSNTTKPATCPDANGTLRLHTSSCYESSSTPSSASEAGADAVFPMLDLPGPLFTLIHGVALFSLSITVLVTCSLLVFLCACRKKHSHHRQQKHLKDMNAFRSTAAVPGRHGASSAGWGRSPRSTSMEDSHRNDADRMTSSETAAR